MIVPPDQLQPDTLDALIEEFVTRDGAVQGHTDTPVHVRMEAVKRQLRSGTVVIVFDEEAASCTMVPKDELTNPALEKHHEPAKQGMVRLQVDARKA